MSQSCSHCYGSFRTTFRWDVEGTGYCNYCVGMHDHISQRVDRIIAERPAIEAETKHLSALFKEFKDGDRADACLAASMLPLALLKRFVAICDANMRYIGSHYVTEVSANGTAISCHKLGGHPASEERLNAEASVEMMQRWVAEREGSSPECSSRRDENAPHSERMGHLLRRSPHVRGRPRPHQP
jgi:hypothetical protein